MKRKPDWFDTQEKAARDLIKKHDLNIDLDDHEVRRALAVVIKITGATNLCGAIMGYAACPFTLAPDSHANPR